MPVQEERTSGIKPKTRSGHAGLFKIEKVPSKDASENGYRMPEESEGEITEAGDFGRGKTMDWLEHSNSDG